MLSALVGLAVAGYITTCEIRAPLPWQSCEARWTLVIGWMLESPLSKLAGYINPKSSHTKPDEESHEDPTS